MTRKSAEVTADVPTLTAGTPTLADFPGAEIVGGAVLLNGQNMGTLLVTGEVETSPVGGAYIANANAEALAPLEVQTITTTPSPVPVGVLDPAKQSPVTAAAKREVRRRKQNEAVVDAMNSPTAEEETAFAAADAASVAPPEPPAAEDQGYSREPR